MCDTFKPNGLRVLGKGGKNKGSKTINVEKNKNNAGKEIRGGKRHHCLSEVMCPGSLNVDLIFVLNTMYIFGFHPLFCSEKATFSPQE